MEVEKIVDRLVEMDIGVGSIAFLCQISTLSRMPSLELTTDGFMICYGTFLGLHIHKLGDVVFCTRMNGDLTETCEVQDQLLANELYAYLVEELLAA